MNQRGGRGFSDYRGRSPRPGGDRSPQYRAPSGADGHLVDESLGSTDGMFRDGRTTTQQMSRGGVSRHFEPKLVYKPKQPASGGSLGFSNAVRHQSSASPTSSVSKQFKSADSIIPSGDAQSVPKDVHLGANDPQNGDKTGYSAVSEKVKVNIMAQQDESRLHSESGVEVRDSLNKGTKNSEENGDSGHYEQGGRTNPNHRPQGGVLKYFEPKPSSGNLHRLKQPASHGGAGFSNVVRRQNSASPTSSVSKPSESADSILAHGDAQSVPKDVHLGASDLQNCDKTGYSAFSEKVKINVISQQDESRLYSKSDDGVGDSLNKGTKNSEENEDYGHSEQGGRTNPHHRPQGGASKHFDPKPSLGNMYRQKQPSFCGGAGFSLHVPKNVGLGAREFQNDDKTGYNAALQLDVSEKIKVTPHLDESRSHFKSDAGIEDSLNKGLNNTRNIGDSGHSEDVKEIKCFDICPSKSGTSINLKPSLLEQNKEKRRFLESHGSVLRPGMVLLKSFLSLNDQVKIVKQCRDLGIGSGGFYQPGYADGRELHLKMMCLGKNWDPETSRYTDFRPRDSTTPPEIPDLFDQFVLKAIENSHTLIRKKSKSINVQNVLPSMSPNICIVNFYTSSGRLGLHQDKDESRQSLSNGLPVVSFSIGDSAEFLYGDGMDVDKAEKVVLESGDLLIFGGEARHIFHGVTKILPNTAPKALLKETNLRPGRLNLTFREY